MFDVGFSEMLMIGIVALVVIGPERLPKVARTAGLFIGRMRRYVSDIKADINREMQLEELKQLKAEMQESAREFERMTVTLEGNPGESARVFSSNLSDALIKAFESIHLSPQGG